MKGTKKEKEEWREWIKRISEYYKDNREEFYNHFNKHIREQPSEDKHVSTINMIAILECMDGRDPVNIFVFNPRDLLKKLREYKEKHDSPV